MKNNERKQNKKKMVKSEFYNFTAWPATLACVRKVSIQKFAHPILQPTAVCTRKENTKRTIGLLR